MSMARQIKRNNNKMLTKQYNGMTKDEVILSFMRNGITQKDLTENYNNGYQDGAIKEGQNIVQAIYASIVRTMIEAGNSHEEVLKFLNEVDSKFVLSFSGDEDCEEVLREFGFAIRFAESVQRVGETDDG